MVELSPSVVVFAVVAAGAVLAAISRVFLPRSRRLAWSTTIVAGIMGAAIAWLPVDYLAPGTSSIVRALVGIGGAIVAVALATTWLNARERRRARGAPTMTIGQLVAEGEGERIELKSTARWNTKRGGKDPRMEDEVVVTIAGFMNAGGGTLLLGVEDDGVVHGLADDYTVVPGRNRDGFELWLRTMLAERLGRAVTADIGVAFEVVDGKDVCRVDVAPADGPVFVSSAGGARTADFHVRTGNATRRLQTDEALEYTRRRWP